MKPLLRWTIGSAHPFGYDVLKKSIQTIKILYGDKFDYIICHNSLSDKEYKIVSNLGVNLYEQSSIPGMFNPKDVAWKLYPPRLRLEAHEIFVDNDIVFLEPLPQIDEFLASSDSFLYSECRLIKPYASYSHLVPDGFQMNSGLFGIPPKFDFEAAIKSRMRDSVNNEWRLRFDEQGMVASIFCEQKTIKIKLEDIFICGPNIWDFEFNKKAYHFAGINRGFKKHWLSFKVSNI